MHSVAPGLSGPQQASCPPDWLADPHWFLQDIDLAAGEARLVNVDRDRLASEVFLDRWDQSGLRHWIVPLSALEEAAPPARPPAMIWHTSFCCSTLLADCLDMPGVCLPLKEPWVLPKLAAGRRGGPDQRLLNGVLSLLGRGFSSGERVVIKPSNGANILIPASAAATGPALLMYSSCRDYLAAVASGGPVVGGGEIRKQAARALLSERALANSPLTRWTTEDLCGLTDFQVAAILWHVQVGEFRAFARAQGSIRVRSLDCARFLANPAAALAAVDNFFDLRIGDQGRAAILAGPKLNQYAKKPEQPFDSGRRQAVFDQVDRAFGRTLDAIVAWSYEVCPETPRGDPVGSPLIGFAH